MSIALRRSVSGPVRVVLAAVVCLMATMAAAGTKYTEALSMDAGQLLASRADHTIMASAFDRLQIDTILKDHVRGVSVVAPTDAAIRSLDPALTDRLKADPVLSTLLLSHHLPHFRVIPDDMVGVPGDKLVVPAYSDSQLTFERVGDDIMVNGVPVTEAVHVANGWVYITDKVLIPERLMKADAPAPGTIMQTAAADPDLTRFTARMRDVGLDRALSDPTQQLTVFAPTDKAIMALPQDLREAILSNPEYFRRVALNHIVRGTHRTGTLRRQASINSISLDTIPIRGGEQKSSTVSVGLANIIQGDIEASNGVIHKIDGVLVPPAVINAIARERAASAPAAKPAEAGK